MKTLSKTLLRLSLITGLSLSFLEIIFICSARAEEPGKKETRETVRAETSFFNPLLPNPKPNNKENAANLLAQGVTRVTGVEVKQTNKGLEVILKTAAGVTKLVPLILPEGNKLVIDFLDATLAFRIRNGVTKTNPVAGIKTVKLAKVDQSSIRLTITGEKQAPRAEVIPSRQNLVLSIDPQGSTARQAPDEEIEIISTGEAAEEEYFVPDADIGGKIDSPLRDVPQSIQVIPQQVIEDQQAIALEEVLENSASVTFLGDAEGASFNVGIRGFERASVFIDGFLNSNTSLTPEVANSERVEVLKGPASIFFGRAEPGGLINLVTKKPLSEPYYNLQFQGGNGDFISPSIDLSGPLTEDGRLLYRLNTLYRQEASVQDYETNFNRFFIAPTLAWKIGDRTDLTVNLEYIKDDNPVEIGTVAFGDGIADIPLERVLNNPEASQEKDSVNIGYTFEHSFSENWQLRNQFRFISDNNRTNAYPSPVSLDESTGILESNLRAYEIEGNNYALYTNIRGKFNTGSVKHNLLFGVDLSRQESEQVSRSDLDLEFPTSINIFDPVYSAIPEPDVEDLPIETNYETTLNQLGIYLQDQIDLLDNLIVAAGVRYDTSDQDSIDTGPFASETSQTESAVTPNVGIVYQPIEPISLYTSYSRSFLPAEDLDTEGEFLEPETGEGFDVGIKAELMENRLSGTLAFFDITKQNVATTDPNDPNALVATGEQRSRGVDFDLGGEILPGWNILASYAYINAEVTEDNDATLVGNKLVGIPEHSFSLWTTYEIQSGSLKGLGFGGGFNFVGARQGGLPNSFEVDSYFLTNTAIFYRRNNWQASLNIDNLFDVGYIESVGSSRTYGILPGDPFTLRASVSVEF